MNKTEKSENNKKKKGLSRNAIIGIGVTIATLLIVGSRYAYSHFFKSEKVVTETRHSKEELAIYDATEEYLKKTISLKKKDCEPIAEEAVRNYDLIINSGVKTVNDEHMAAIAENITKSMIASIPNIEEMSDNEIIALSSDICEIVWNDIMWQIASMDSESAKEYNLLFDSIQRSMKESKNGRAASGALNVTVKDVSVDPETILASVKNMNASQLEELKERMDVMNENNSKMLTATVNVPNSSLVNDSSLVGRDGKNGSDGRDGKDGRDGEKGATGARGEKGDSGEKGEKGEAGAKGDKGEAGEDGIGGYVDGREATYMIDMDTSGSEAVVTFTPTVK